MNLNLLKALHALLSEQNVSKAGQSVRITQSAMSIALKQLRDIYKDDLLVRGQHGRMTLTSFAKSLLLPVKQALQAAEIAFTAHLPFNYKITNRTFHIGMSDYLALVLLPKLMKIITEEAPNINIIQHATNHLDSLKPFEENSLDIAIGQFVDAPHNLKVTSLFYDKGVLVADKKHPIFKKNKITLEEYAKYPQVFISMESRPDQNKLIKHIEDQGCKLDVALMTPHTIIALQTLPGTFMISNVVEHLAHPFLKKLGLSVHATPYKVKDFHAQMYWHAKDHNDSGHQWLRELIKKVARSVP